MKLFVDRYDNTGEINSKFQFVPHPSSLWHQFCLLFHQAGELKKHAETINNIREKGGELAKI
jgi:hypothetical protein